MKIIERERAIEIPIIINENNFFNKPETQRIDFIKFSILNKLNLMKKVIEINRLDTDIQLLILDCEKVLDKFK